MVRARRRSDPAARRLTDERPGIWISYVPASSRRGDIASAHGRAGTTAASPSRELPFESAKIGGGPPPITGPGGLAAHPPRRRKARSYPASTHVASRARWSTAPARCCSIPDDPSRVLARTAEPLLEPETVDERVGTVANVVFPTAIATIDDRDVRLLRHGRRADRRRRAGANGDRRAGVERQCRCGTSCMRGTAVLEIRNRRGGTGMAEQVNSVKHVGLRRDLDASMSVSVSAVVGGSAGHTNDKGGGC